LRLYNLLADRLLQYTALCGDGNAKARGGARTKVEAMLPQDGWLGKLLSPTLGKSSRSTTWRAGSRRHDRTRPSHILPSTSAAPLAW
jgi:hypothetical protein